ncbi:hypothetical protein NHH03_14720 [Stieleria sp. TO1_6]|uniref:hypothetical protein n=1 Tax=Stieleria tagensis TaxID=2956795 RepID=UPI00209B98D8|nr:hypothetical protein [Stieleria tagensis]MCO8122999.1 hypothetical protein [Stieleria tagensis]
MANDDDPVENDSTADVQQDEGPGCMPALLAIAALMGIVGFIFCGVMTWLIFQKQDELALRSMRGSFIPAVEQSLLEPKEKAGAVKLLGEFADEIERGQLEGWQASGVMQRLTRLPILQWGQIRKVERFVDSHTDDFPPDASIQFDRLRKGVESNQITTLDFAHILSPVLQTDPSLSDSPLVETLDVKSVGEVVKRARISAERAKVDQTPKNDVSIDTLIRREITNGIEHGTY